MCKNYQVLFVLSICCFCKISIGLNFPPDFPKCYRIEDYETSKEYTDCIVRKAEEAKPFLMKGIPELGVPNLSDIVIPRIDVEQKARAFQYRITLRNLAIQGLVDFQFDSLIYTIENITYSGRIRFPKVDLKGSFEIWGRIFDQNINRTGPAKATITNTTVDITVQAYIDTEKGINYYDIVSIDTDVNVGKAIGTFDNLFGQAETLNKAVNAFLEQSTTDIINLALPDFKKLIRNILLNFIKRFTKVLTYDQIFDKRGKE